MRCFRRCCRWLGSRYRGLPYSFWYSQKCTHLLKHKRWYLFKYRTNWCISQHLPRPCKLCWTSALCNSTFWPWFSGKQLGKLEIRIFGGNSAWPSCCRHSFQVPPDPTVTQNSRQFAFNFNFDTDYPKLSATNDVYTESSMSFMMPLMNLILISSVITVEKWLWYKAQQTASSL